MKLRTSIFSLALAMTACFTAAAQETCPLPVMVTVDNSDGALTAKNVKLLDSKLKQLVASKGYGSTSDLSHLSLHATVSETGDKQVISGNRMIVSGSYDVYLVLTNLLSGETFGAENITVRGAGNNEGRLMQSAMSRINPSNKELQNFLQNARVKVFDYYRSHIPSIITQARSESQRGNYDKALYLLSTVPPCVEGQDSVANVMFRIFQEYLDVDCAKKLASARAVWAVSKNDEGARAAAAYIAAIDSRSACNADAQALLAEISGHLDENMRRIIAREDEDRALEKEILRGEFAHRHQLDQKELELRQQEIDAIRQIAQAYAQSVLGPLVKKPENRPADNSNANDGDGKNSRVIIVNN